MTGFRNASPIHLKAVEMRSLHIVHQELNVTAPPKVESIKMESAWMKRPILEKKNLSKPKCFFLKLKEFLWSLLES